LTNNFNNIVPFLVFLAVIYNYLDFGAFLILLEYLNVVEGEKRLEELKKYLNEYWKEVGLSIMVGL